MQLPGLAQPMELKGKAETQVHFPVSPTRAVVVATMVRQGLLSPGNTNKLCKKLMKRP